MWQPILTASAIAHQPCFSASNNILAACWSTSAFVRSLRNLPHPYTHTNKNICSSQGLCADQIKTQIPLAHSASVPSVHFPLRVGYQIIRLNLPAQRPANLSNRTLTAPSETNSRSFYVNNPFCFIPNFNFQIVLVLIHAQHSASSPSSVSSFVVLSEPRVTRFRPSKSILSILSKTALGETSHFLLILYHCWTFAVVN